MTVKAIDLVRRIRDPLNEEMKALSAAEQRAYLHQKALEARKKLNQTRPSRKARSTRA